MAKAATVWIVLAAALLLAGCGRATEYRGQWYGCCAGADYYGGPSATFSTFNRPMAVYHKGRTYFVYGGVTHAEIGWFDHARGKFGPALKLFPLAEGDGHRNPSLLITPDDQVWVFFGGHGEDTRVWRSDTRLTVWRVMPSIPGVTSYPQPWLVNGKITVLYRLGLDEAVTTWTGKGWSPPVTIIKGGGRGVYAISMAGRDRIHVIWTLIDLKAQARRNIYAASFSTPAPLVGETIYDSGADQVQTSDLQLDAAGRPWALVSAGSGDHWRYLLIGPDGPETIAPTDDQFDVGALIMGPAITALLPTGGPPGQDGGDMTQWTRGPSGWTPRPLTRGDNYARAVFKGQPAFRAFWSHGDTIKPGPVSLYAMGREPMAIPGR